MSHLSDLYAYPCYKRSYSLSLIIDQNSFLNSPLLQNSKQALGTTYLSYGLTKEILEAVKTFFPFRNTE